MSLDDLSSYGTPKISIQAVSEFFPDLEIVDIASPLVQKTFQQKKGGDTQGRLRYGDINIDGYPDLFLTLLVKDQGELKYKSVVLISQPVLLDCEFLGCRDVDWLRNFPQVKVKT